MHRLERHQTERDILLARAIDLLQADPRVCAAWLAGSLGRGDSDGWSDLDLWVIVSDEHIAEVAATRREFAARLSAPHPPLLIEEAPQNAPAHGAYLLVIYPAAAAPLIVDWYWQPRSAAALRPEHRVLFDHVGLSRADLPPTASADPAQATERAIFFWAMAAIALKKIGREHNWAALRLIESMRLALEDARWHMGARDMPPDYKESSRWPDAPPATSAEQLALLKRLCQTLDALDVPDPDHRFRGVIAPTFDMLAWLEQGLSEAIKLKVKNDDI